MGLAPWNSLWSPGSGKEGAGDGATYMEGSPLTDQAPPPSY